MSSKHLWILVVLGVIMVAGGLVWLSGDGSSTLLTGEQDNSASEQATVLSEYRSEPVNKKFTDEQCNHEDSDRCATVTVKSLAYQGRSALNQRIRQRLLAMAEPIADDRQDEPVGADYREYAQSFFHEYHEVAADMPSALAYSADLSAEEVARHDGLLVLRLDSYLFTGGAHGMPQTRYMVIEAGKDRVLSLADMLKPGQRQAFDWALQHAYDKWADEQGPGNDFWSFTRNDNVAPLEDGMAVTYQAYDIAPYAAGQPTLKIPYKQLEGILKSRYIPASGDDGAQD